MAILKGDGYNRDLKIETGDSEFDQEHAEQLAVSMKELTSAINAENVCDKLFARILHNRTKAHQSLVEKIPGAKIEG